MPNEAPLQVGFLCYPRLTLLDMTGPYEVLVRMPNTKVHILWKEKIPVSTEDGLQIVAAGLLEGYGATSHWMFLPLLEPFGAFPTAERVVVDRNRITGAGVSAGIDCALCIVSLLRGREAAEAIQLQIEYDPQPPFDCGSPQKAPELLVQRLRQKAKPTFEARREVIERIAKSSHVPRRV